jgi:serine/threonine-protein kinase
VTDDGQAEKKPSITPTVPSGDGRQRVSAVRETAVSVPHPNQGEPVPPPGPPVVVGGVLNGKYRIDGVLGEGGVGIVFSAHHLELDDRVAIKFLRPESVGDRAIVARFAREAKAALSIRSEHVARILDVGTVEGTGVPFIVMEYLEGKDFCSTLKTQGVFSPQEAAEYVLQVCEALAIAHAKGIVHRDIKPENLFLTTTQHGRHIKVAKVLDFGISKAALTGSMFRDEIPLVSTGHLMGTPLYMSPEQVRAASEVDARSDIWSLGLVMYEMLTGKTAFNAASLTELCAAILEREPVPIRDLRPEIPEGLALAVQRCLHKNPAERFQNIGALAQALLPFAPKRSRVWAERAMSVLAEAGMAEPELKVHSTMPPPTDEALEVANSLSQQVRVASAVSVSTAQPNAAASSGRQVVAIVVGALAAIGFGVVCTLLMVRHPSPAPAPSATSIVAVPTEMPSRDGLDVPSAPPSTPVSLPGAASPVVSASTTVAPGPTPSSRPGQRVHGTPGPAPSSSATRPAPANKPPSDEGPDLGY